MVYTLQHYDQSPARLINIGSYVAFNAFTGLVIAGFYSSFLVAASLILLKRLTKQDVPVRWGPFTLGRAGIPVNAFSIAYSIIGIFFSLSGRLVLIPLRPP